jgi:hypothetical protein
MTTATVTYCGVDLDCKFEFYPAEARTQWEPGCPAYAALETVTVGGVDITEMLTNAQQDEIEVLLVDEHAASLEAERAEYLWERRQERLMESQYP